jgi:hypothetical protein
MNDASHLSSEKRCVKCGESKPLSEFYEQKQMRDGRRNDCKRCMAKAAKERYARDPSKAIRGVQRWRERNPDRYADWLRRNREERKDERALIDRAGHLRRKYGLTLDDLNFLHVVQAYRCAICGVLSEALHVDHDHESGMVRGLLCGNCNKAIGLFHEDPERFHAAERYLRRTQLTLGCGDRRES